MSNNICARCKWLSDDFTSVCVNADSEHCADYVSATDSCEKFEPGLGGKFMKYAKKKIDCEQ